MSQTNQTQEQPIAPISPETATIITLSIIIIAIIVLIIICIHKICNQRKQRNSRKNNRVPDFQQGQHELRVLSQEQINNLPPEQRQKLQQYQIPTSTPTREYYLHRKKINESTILTLNNIGTNNNSDLKHNNNPDST